MGDNDKKSGGAAGGGPPDARSGRVPTGGWVERGRTGEEAVTGPVIIHWEKTHTKWKRSFKIKKRQDSIPKQAGPSPRFSIHGVS